jgi:hypothetical protein
MIHKQKIAWIEGAPKGWPDGWAFGPLAPCPPGWPMKLDLDGVKLLAGQNDGEILIRVQDKWDEKTDILDGHALRFQAASGRELLRMRLDEQAPWSEQLVLIVRDGGVSRKILLDWNRAELPSAAILVQTFAVQPSLSVSLRVQRENHG